MTTNAEEPLERLVRSLVDCGFLFSVRDFSPEARETHFQRTTAFLRRTAKLCKVADRIAIPVIESVLDKGLSPIHFHPVSRMDFDFDARGFQKELDVIRSCVDLVCFRYVLLQPVITAVVLADALTANEKRAIFEQFDRTMLRLRPFTSSMRAGFGKVKMCVTGMMLWCFEDPATAKCFIDNEKEQLRKMHFWKKVYAFSWCVDLHNCTLTKHKGLPFVIGVFDSKTFLRALSHGH